MRRRLGSCFMIVGVLCILGAFGLTGYNVYESYQAQEISANAIKVLSDQIAAMELEKEQNEKDEVPEYVLFPEMELPTIKIDDERYIGILHMPSIDISLPVMGGEWSYAKLRKAPCLYSGSVYQNDMIIAGHNYRSHFSKIKGMDEGSEIYFVDVDGNIFSYEISWVEILRPEAVESLMEGDDWDLTLFTCTYGGNERYVVRCNLTE